MLSVLNLRHFRPVVSLLTVIAATLLPSLASAQAESDVDDRPADVAPAAIVDAAATTDTLRANADPSDQDRTGFRFGSYGRVVVDGDLEGGRGKRIQIVSHPPRLIENNYIELDFAYAARLGEALFETIITPAISDALFHLDGNFDGVFALRNAFVRASGFGVDGLSAWAGSRMYRGDDIYLLDFWPLDDLNTVGGGIEWGIGDTNVRLHGGMNQLDDTFQYQEITLAGPGFDTEQQILLDRVRALGSLRVQHNLLNIVGDLGAKFVLYGDVQSLGEGQFEDANEVLINLPSDLGWTVGAELGTWGFADSGFANLFFRYSQGLAAYGELGVPFGTDNDRSVADSQLIRLATSFNVEAGRLGVTGGGYIQWFSDADDNTYDSDDYWETAFSVRPTLFVTDFFHQAIEASYQRRRTDGLNPRTDTFLESAVWQFALMPTLTFGPHVFSRPQIRVIYAVSLLNEGAQNLFPETDPRHQRDVQHYLGIGAEWWFDRPNF